MKAVTLIAVLTVALAAAAWAAADASKAAYIVLTKEQIEAVDASPAGVTLTLTADQAQTVKDQFPGYEGTTVWVGKEHICNHGTALVVNAEGVAVAQKAPFTIP
jgi:hypothetical protein